MLHYSYKATMSVAGSGGVPEEMKDTLKLHTVTDCNSLHECITKQGLPEDKRAAIEVLSIREMLSREDDGSGSELEDDDRLRESDLRSVYHWTVSEDQKSDIFTKKCTREQRAARHEDLNWIFLRSKKRSDVQAEKAIPSRPRPRLDLTMAKTIMQKREEEAIAAGFEVSDLR